ncbi:MAG: cell division protein FtsH, partial [Candidatus Marinimicrobia bacterium]|nr:cell division protein FtsH [Candidatus Neomarinimicrobiota bacterium]
MRKFNTFNRTKRPKNKKQIKPPITPKDSLTRKKKKTPSDDNEFKWKKASKTSLMWIIIIISSIFLIQILGTGSREEVVIEYFQYKDLLANGQIKEATIIEREFHGVLKEKVALIIGGRPVDVEKFYFILPPVIDK